MTGEIIFVIFASICVIAIVQTFRDMWRDL